jgi:hypothetical protein
VGAGLRVRTELTFHFVPCFIVFQVVECKMTAEAWREEELLAMMFASDRIDLFTTGWRLVREVELNLNIQQFIARWESLYPGLPSNLAKDNACNQRGEVFSSGKGLGCG